jgi:hypothetical protein
VKQPRRRIEVNLEELDRVLDGAREAPLSEVDHHKLREALHALAAMLVRPRNTEKTSSVVGKPDEPDADNTRQQEEKTSPPPGHGRNGAEAVGARHRPGAACGHGVLSGALALRRVRAACSRRRRRKAWARISTINRRRP